VATFVRAGPNTCADNGRGEPGPPRQKAASFTIDQVVEKLEAAITSHR
jgi:hypothetical protein